MNAALVWFFVVAAVVGVTGAAVLETNYLRVYLAQIRRKLEPNPARPRYFLTEPRMGYRFLGDATG